MNYTPPTSELTNKLIKNVDAGFTFIRSQVASRGLTLYKHSSPQMTLIQPLLEFLPSRRCRPCSYLTTGLTFCCFFYFPRQRQLQFKVSLVLVSLDPFLVGRSRTNLCFWSIQFCNYGLILHNDKCLPH